MTKKIYWRKLTLRHRIHVTPEGEFRTGSGALVYWHGNEAKDAQHALVRMLGKRRKAK